MDDRLAKWMLEGNILQRVKKNEGDISLLQKLSIPSSESSSVPFSLLNDTKEPTGWLDPDAAAAACTYDSATQKITLTGTHYYYWRGVKHSVTDYVSTAHTNTVGHIYRLYSTDGETFTWSTDTEWAWTDVMLATVDYQTAYKYARPETHGLMQYQVHEELHQTIGTYKETGGMLDPASYTINSTTAANRRPNVVAANLHDEDINHVLAALTSKTYNKLSLSSTETVNYSGLTAEIVSVTGAQPNYNLFTGGAWTQAAMANNSYMCVWLVGQPTTHEANSESFRYLWVQGQSNGTLVSQQALTPSDVSLGTLTDEIPEFVFLAKIIIQYTAADWKITSVDELSGNHFSQTSSPSGAFLSSVSTDGSLTGDGTTGNPLSAASGATTASAAGTTALTVSSARVQELTGITTHTHTLPVVSTLKLGFEFVFINNSTGAWTINSSGGNLVQTIAAGQSAIVRCVLITGTTAASWSSVYSMNPAQVKNLTDGSDADALHAHTYANLSDAIIGAWGTWTPTLTNITVGASTTQARYRVEDDGKTTHFNIVFTLGVGGAIGTDPQFTLPSNVAPTRAVALAFFIVAGNVYAGAAQLAAGSSTCILRVYKSDATYTTQAVITATVPATWTTGNQIIISGTYEGQ